MEDQMDGHPPVGERGGKLSSPGQERFSLLEGRERSFSSGGARCPWPAALKRFEILPPAEPVDDVPGVVAPGGETPCSKLSTPCRKTADSFNL